MPIASNRMLDRMDACQWVKTKPRLGRCMAIVRQVSSNKAKTRVFLFFVSLISPREGCENTD